MLRTSNGDRSNTLLRALDGLATVSACRPHWLLSGALATAEHRIPTCPCRHGRPLVTVGRARQKGNASEYASRQARTPGRRPGDARGADRTGRAAGDGRTGRGRLRLGADVPADGARHRRDGADVLHAQRRDHDLHDVRDDGRLHGRHDHKPAGADQRRAPPPDACRTAGLPALSGAEAEAGPAGRERAAGRAAGTTRPPPSWRRWHAGPGCGNGGRGTRTSPGSGSDSGCAGPRWSSCRRRPGRWRTWSR